MKRQIIALIAGVALIAAPLATHNAIAKPAGGRGNKLERMARRLNLTDAQKTALKEIHQRKKAQMKAVFTPEQLAKLEAARTARKQQRAAARANGETGQFGRRSRRQGRRALMQSLNLTDAQKAEMKAIRKSAKAEMKAILTPEQQAQVQQMKQQRRQRRQQRRQQQ